MGQVDLMRLGLSRTDPLQGDLEEVLADCERAAALTRHLLVFSRQQMLEPRVVEARGVVAGLEKMLRRLLREDIVFDLDVEGSTSSVRIDPGQLEQIVLNLSVNARDAMPNGGELHIRLKDLALEEEDASSEPDVAPGRYVALEVSDSGSGMTPEVASRIFEPFFSTKEVGKGTGLGLSTVFGIVGRVKGHVKVDTELGRGSRFTVLLPRVEPETPSVGEAPAETEGGNETILLVEDDDHVRRSTKAILERSGYYVLSARSGSEALSLARDRAASIDLLVSDVIMPRMGGRELAGRLRETRPKLKTIFISGYAGEEAPHDAPVFDTLLLKPFSARSLTDRVRQVLDGRDEPLSAGVGQS
jgi:CheY-like chemotaxis protein